MKGRRPFSDSEVTMIAAGFRGRFARRDKALFLLGVRSGFRISELQSITIGQLRAGDQIVDFLSIERSAMKGKHEGRTVPLHPEAREALSAWLLEFDPFRRRAPETFVFQSREGSNRPISRPRVKQIFDAVCSPAGITGPIGTHSMRKTFAKRVYEKSGRDLFRTQQALGHRSINSTVSYLGDSREDIDSLILSA